MASGVSASSTKKRDSTLLKARLARAGIQAVIVPPYYWGVNRVTGDFAGSIDIRPEVMIELMLDVFRSLKRAGFREGYCARRRPRPCCTSRPIASIVNWPRP